MALDDWLESLKTDNGQNEVPANDLPLKPEKETQSTTTEDNVTDGLPLFDFLK